MSGKAIGLYFHIPFCTRKCDYCHFYVLPDKEQFKEILWEGLEIELSKYADLIHNNTIVSIYFGGGTPALFGPKRIGNILKKIPFKQAEITLEANPENISYDLMRAYADEGINRVSTGLQSLDDTQLKVLTRTHDSQKAIDAVAITAKAGISNISVDLMFDLPNQTLDSWEKSLHRAANLPIKHLSLYNLTFEPHTVYYKKRESLTSLTPSEDVSRQMYQAAQVILPKYGLSQYEISAFCKQGYQAVHNTGYWEGRPFLGFGPSAFSYWEGSRYRNIAHLNKYIELLRNHESSIDFEEKLDKISSQRELLSIRLRLIAGVDLEKFEKEWGQIDPETMENLKDLVQEGYLIKEGASLKMSPEGILYYDDIAARLVG